MVSAPPTPAGGEPAGVDYRHLMKGVGAVVASIERSDDLEATIQDLVEAIVGRDRKSVV